MSTNRSLRANRPKIWSISRRSLMNQCPRAWVLKYGFAKSRGLFNRHLRNIADWSTPWRLMQRALRGVIIDRLECHSNEKIWIEKDLASKIRHRIIGGISRQKSIIDVVETRIGGKSNLRYKVKKSEIIAKQKYILSITENGFGKRTSFYDYRTTNRGGKGIIGIINSDRNGSVAASFPVNEGDEIILSTDKGRVIRCAVKEIRSAGRNTQGVRIFKLSGEEKVVSAIKIEDNFK